jgi:hypothetical protein
VRLETMAKASSDGDDFATVYLAHFYKFGLGTPA